MLSSLAPSTPGPAWNFSRDRPGPTGRGWSEAGQNDGASLLLVGEAGQMHGTRQNDGARLDKMMDRGWIIHRASYLLRQRHLVFGHFVQPRSIHPRPCVEFFATYFGASGLGPSILRPVPGGADVGFPARIRSGRHQGAFAGIVAGRHKLAVGGRDAVGLHLGAIMRTLGASSKNPHSSPRTPRLVF